MKRLHFSPNLIDLIMTGKKTSTWRLWDDKDLTEGEVIEFANSKTRAVFAKAKLVKVVEKPFDQLSEEEKVGHEKYNDPNEVYEKFSGYYGRKVDQNTPFKVIKFELVN